VLLELVLLQPLCTQFPEKETAAQLRGAVACRQPAAVPCGKAHEQAEASRCEHIADVRWGSLLRADALLHKVVLRLESSLPSIDTCKRCRAFSIVRKAGRPR
jgi:hypothetical protein